MISVSRRLTLVSAIVLATVALGWSPVLNAYLKIGTDVGGRTLALKWTRLPIRYFVTNRGVPGVTPNELRGALARAFGSWEGVAAAGLSSEFAGFTDAAPLDSPGATVIGFAARADLENVLGSTRFGVDTVTGELLESDIFLNSTFGWSVASNGEPGRFDLESIAAHEIGHLLGLSHSAIGETNLSSGGQRSVIAKRAVMFPIAYPPANIEDRTLEADDVAGLSDIYAATSARLALGSISGRVRLNGSGIFGAHVVAFNTATGTLTGNFSLTSDGSFVIGGLAPGVYVVRAEPLDDADLDGFFGDSTAVNTSFRPAYASSLVAVPAGGSGDSIEIRVAPK